MTAQTSTTGSYREIFSTGIWSNNPGMAQLLGLCPLLAVSRTLLAGLALGIATLLYSVPLSVALAHQALAMIVLGMTVGNLRAEFPARPA